MEADRGRVALTGRLSAEQLEAMLADLDEQAARVLRLIWEEGQADGSGEETTGMVPLTDGIRLIASGLGLPPIDLLQELERRWAELAGPQWGSNAVPIVVRHGELLVEAADRRIVRWLRHDTAPLVERLAGHFGGGFVTKVRVVGPPGRRSW